MDSGLDSGWILAGFWLFVENRFGQRTKSLSSDLGTRKTLHTPNEIALERSPELENRFGQRPKSLSRLKKAGGKGEGMKTSFGHRVWAQSALAKDYGHRIDRSWKEKKLCPSKKAFGLSFENRRTLWPSSEIALKNLRKALTALPPEWEAPSKISDQKKTFWPSIEITFPQPPERNIDANAMATDSNRIWPLD